MKNTISVILLVSVFTIFASNAKQNPQWKGTIEEEDGDKVIRNPNEPLYGEITFDLEEDLSIGNEEDENYVFYRAIGISVDSEGNIYLRNRPESTEKHFFKFDNAGRFISSFGSNGQGPGEFMLARIPRISQADEIIVSDIIQRKLVVFDTNCNFVKEIPINMEISEIYPLIDGKYLM